jgi:hypothetical protein
MLQHSPGAVNLKEVKEAESLEIEKRLINSFGVCRFGSIFSTNSVLTRKPHRLIVRWTSKPTFRQ